MEPDRRVSHMIEQFYTPVTVTIFKSCYGGEYCVRYQAQSG